MRLKPLDRYTALHLSPLKFQSTVIRHQQGPQRVCPSVAGKSLLQSNWSALAEGRKQGEEARKLCHHVKHIYSFTSIFLLMTSEREINSKASLKSCCFPQSVYMCFGIFTLAIFSKVSVIKKRRQNPTNSTWQRARAPITASTMGIKVIDFNWCPRGKVSLLGTMGVFGGN